MRTLPKVTKDSFLPVFLRRADSYRTWLDTCQDGSIPAAFWGAELQILAGADHINELEEWIARTREEFPDSASSIDEILADKEEDDI
jgi:hypothetical protein